MFPAESAPACLRRPPAGEALALRARRQTAGSHLQLGRVQSEQLSEAQTHSAKEAPGRAVAMTTGLTPATALRTASGNFLPPVRRAAPEVHPATPPQSDKRRPGSPGD